MTRRDVETVRLGKRILGAIVWDHWERMAWFKPYTDELEPLGRETWSCPVMARADVHALAREVGI